MAPGSVSVNTAMTTAITISAGIMMRFAFSMPPFTPRATIRNTAAMKMSMNSELSAPLAMKPVKNAPPSAIASGPAAM